MNSASLAGRYDNPIPTRFLGPIDFLKIPAEEANDITGRMDIFPLFSETIFCHYQQDLFSELLLRNKVHIFLQRVPQCMSPRPDWDPLSRKQLSVSLPPEPTLACGLGGGAVGGTNSDDWKKGGRDTHACGIEGHRVVADGVPI